jgi:hypothetical protein
LTVVVTHSPAPLAFTSVNPKTAAQTRFAIQPLEQSKAGHVKVVTEVPLHTKAIASIGEVGGPNIGKQYIPFTSKFSTIGELQGLVKFKQDTGTGVVVGSVVVVAAVVVVVVVAVVVVGIVVVVAVVVAGGNVVVAVVVRTIHGPGTH